MIKFLIIGILIIYSFYRVAAFLFKFMLGGFSKGQFDSTQYRPRKPRNSNLNVDRVPKGEAGRKKDYGGGDYVDFEEVK